MKEPKFTLHQRGLFLIQRICNLFLFGDNYSLLPSRLCTMGKVYLRIRSHKRGLGLTKECVMNTGTCVMNMGESHECKRGCILKLFLEPS